MACTLAQAAARRGLPPPASESQETRPQDMQSREDAEKRAEPNCTRIPTVKETCRQGPQALPSRGPRREQPIETAVAEPESVNDGWDNSIPLNPPGP
ncbi:hypothetical protein VTG60DRAFT_5948 [Thermothelomyces hinnuleus]